jgi:hypothetical protein
MKIVCLAPKMAPANSGGSDGDCKRPLFHRLKCHFETMAANIAGTLRQYDDNNSRHDPNTIRRVVRDCRPPSAALGADARTAIRRPEICRLRLAPVSGISA